MKKTLFKYVMILLTINSFSQNQSERLNFLIMIDNQISGLNISEGYFTIADSLGNVKEKINFEYHVGYLQLSAESYEKFYSLSNPSKITIQFKNRTINPSFKEVSYQYVFSSDWINKEYMLLKIYNFSKQNRKIYWFDKNVNYVSEFSIPSKGTVIPKCK